MIWAYGEVFILDRIIGLSHLQIELLATLLLLEGVILAVFPEEMIMLTLGLLWGRGQVGFFESLFAVQIGLIPANVVMVFIGNKIGLKILSVPPFSWFLSTEAIAKALSHVYRHSALTIFVSRFTPTIRGPIYVAVGISKTSIKRFIKIDFLASLIQVPLLIFAGRLLGEIFPLESVYKYILYTSLGLLVFSVLLTLFNVSRKKGRMRSSF